MTGREIVDDMFGVARRLKSIDDGYFVFLNYATGKFEVHNRKERPNTLCLVLPFDTLDERTVNRVLYTRAERVEKLVADMERNNAIAEKARLAAAVDKAACAVQRDR